MLALKKWLRCQQMLHDMSEMSSLPGVPPLGRRVATCRKPRPRGCATAPGLARRTGRASRWATVRGPLATRPVGGRPLAPCPIVARVAPAPVNPTRAVTPRPLAEHGTLASIDLLTLVGTSTVVEPRTLVRTLTRAEALTPVDAHRPVKLILPRPVRALPAL
jgi:hypothetical protein